jgi:hypothetical protein
MNPEYESTRGWSAALAAADSDSEPEPEPDLHHPTSSSSSASRTHESQSHSHSHSHSQSHSPSHPSSLAMHTSISAPNPTIQRGTHTISLSDIACLNDADIAHVHKLATAPVIPMRGELAHDCLLVGRAGRLTQDKYHCDMHHRIDMLERQIFSLSDTKSGNAAAATASAAATTTPPSAHRTTRTVQRVRTTQDSAHELEASLQLLHSGVKVLWLSTWSHSNVVLSDLHCLVACLRCPNLRELHIMASFGIEGTAFIPLLHTLCPHLRTLNVRLSPVQDSVIAQLTHPMLRELDLQSCLGVDYTFLNGLNERCPSLHSLNLMGLRITDSILESSLSHSVITSLFLSECEQLNGDGWLSTLQDRCPSLKFLYLNGTSIDNAMIGLIRHDTLRCLDVSDKKIDDAAIDGILSRCPRIRSLVCERCIFVSSASTRFYRAIEQRYEQFKVVVDGRAEMLLPIIHHQLHDSDSSCYSRITSGQTLRQSQEPAFVSQFLAHATSDNIYKSMQLIFDYAGDTCKL